MQWRVVLYGFQQSARTTADDNRWFLCCQFLSDCRSGFLQIIRVNHPYPLNTNRMAQCFQVNCCGHIATNGFSGSWVLLLTGHAGDGVIQNQYQRITLVVSNINQAGNTGVNKGGVTDYRYGFLFAFRTSCFVKTMERRYRCAHADAGIHRIQRRRRAQGVAANVTADKHLLFFQGIEDTSVGTTAAHCRRTHWNFLIQCNFFRLFAQHQLGNQGLRELPANREQILSDDLYPVLAAEMLNHRI